MMGKKNGRKTNLDCLRILAMIFIIAHHCVINDFGLQEILKNHTYVGTERINEVIILGILNSCFIIGVNIFFLLSGYLGINFKWQKLIGLILKTCIIYGMIAGLGIATGNLTIDFNFIKKVLDPLDMYWFIMTYILLYIASPLLNMIIDNISYEMSKRYFAGVMIICCGYGFIVDRNLHIEKGYSFLMAMALYVIGGILRKWKVTVKTSICYGGGIVCILINTIVVLLFYIMGFGNISWRMYSYNNPLVLIYSIVILFIFVNISEIRGNKVLSKYAAGTLTVYMIHSTCWLSRVRGIPIINMISEYGFLFAIICLPIYVAIIYTIGIIVDCLYEKYLGIAVNKIIGNIISKK